MVWPDRLRSSSRSTTRVDLEHVGGGIDLPTPDPSFALAAAVARHHCLARAIGPLQSVEGAWPVACVLPSAPRLSAPSQRGQYRTSPELSTPQFEKPRKPRHHKAKHAATGPTRHTQPTSHTNPTSHTSHTSPTPPTIRLRPGPARHSWCLSEVPKRGGGPRSDKTPRRCVALTGGWPGLHSPKPLVRRWIGTGVHKLGVERRGEGAPCVWPTHRWCWWCGFRVGVGVEVVWASRSRNGVEVEASGRAGFCRFGPARWGSPACLPCGRVGPV